MSAESSNAKSGGIGLCTLLTVVFVAMKLAHIGDVADWSWWWVLAPTWIPLALVISVLIVIGLIALVTAAEDKRRYRR